MMKSIFNFKDENKGQILVITLLIMMILSIIVLSTVTNLTRDVQERVFNEVYEENYSYAETKLFTTIKFFEEYYGGSSFASFDPRAESPARDDLEEALREPLKDPLGRSEANCEELPAVNSQLIPGFLCNIEESENITDVRIEFSNSVSDMEVNKNDALQLILTKTDGSYYNNYINLSWTGNVIWSMTLIYQRQYGTQSHFEVVKEYYDGNQNTGKLNNGKFVFSNNTTNSVRINSLAPSSIVGANGVNDAKMNTGSEFQKLVYLRMRPIIIGGGSTSLSISGDASFPVQFLDASAQSYQPDLGDSSPTPLLAVKRPLNPSPPGIFDYVYYTNGEINYLANDLTFGAGPTSGPTVPPTTSPSGPLAYNYGMFYGESLTGGVSFDNGGNIFLAGNIRTANVDMNGTAGTDLYSNDTSVSTSDADITISKYTTAGNYVWTRKIGGVSEDSPNDIETGPSGEVYVAGSYGGPSSGTFGVVGGGSVDFNAGAGTDIRTSSGPNVGFITKYDTNGNYQWTRTAGEAGSVTVAYTDLAINQSDGSIYVAGIFQGTNVDLDGSTGVQTFSSNLSTEDLFISKYNSNGQYQWTRIIGASGQERANDIKVGNDGNLYIAGYYSTTTDMDPGAGVDNKTNNGSLDSMIVKLDPSGNYIWSRVIGGGLIDQIKSMVIVGSDIYVGGQFSSASIDLDPTGGVSSHTNPNTFENSFVANYGTDGSFKWAKSFGDNAAERLIELQVNANGIYIFGDYLFNTGLGLTTTDFDPSAATYSLTNNGSLDNYLSKLDLNGNFEWAYGLGGNNLDYSSDIGIAGSDIFLFGYSNSSSLNLNFINNTDPRAPVYFDTYFISVREN